MRKVNSLGIWLNANTYTTWHLYLLISSVLDLFQMTVGTIIVMFLKTMENNSLAFSKA